jgi:hypothetical protein
MVEIVGKNNQKPAIGLYELQLSNVVQTNPIVFFHDIYHIQTNTPR